MLLKNYFWGSNIYVQSQKPDALYCTLEMCSNIGFRLEKTLHSVTKQH